MTPPANILGVILAGGTARRMGGGDKGLSLLAGKPMLAHVQARFAPQVVRLVLNANGPAVRFQAFGLEIVADEGPGDQGPLAGLAAAYTWAASMLPGTTSIATVSTDVPFLPLDLVQRLNDGAQGGAKVAVAAFEGQWHPVIGLWPVHLANGLDQYLRTGQRSAEAFAKRHGAVAVSFPPGLIAGQHIDPFFNANTPDDLAWANKLLLGET